MSSKLFLQKYVLIESLQAIFLWLASHHHNVSNLGLIFFDEGMIPAWQFHQTGQLACESASLC